MTPFLHREKVLNSAFLKAIAKVREFRILMVDLGSAKIATYIFFFIYLYHILKVSEIFLKIFKLDLFSIECRKIKPSKCSNQSLRFPHILSSLPCRVARLLLDSPTSIIWKSMNNLS